MIGSNVLIHFLLNRLKFFITNWVHVEVVVEAVVNWWPNSRLGIWEYLDDGLRQKVSTGMAQNVESFSTLAVNRLKAAVRIQNVGKVALDAVD